VLHSQKSSAACCPTASISNGASSVGLVTTARVEVRLNKNLKNNPLLKNLEFSVGAKNLVFILLGFCDVAGCNSFQIGTTTFVLLVLIKFDL